MPSSSAHRLQLLGTATLSTGEVRCVLPTRKLFGLLAHLAVEGPTERGRLAGLFWESTEERARANLRSELYRLRQAGVGELIAEDQGVFRLVSVQVDLLQFREAVAAEQWARACELDRGQLLQDFALREAPAFEEWLAPVRETHERDRQRVLSRRARELEATGELLEALKLYGRLLERNAFDEESHRAVMRLHARQGEHGQALAIYTQLEERLRRELDVAPEPETAALAAELRAGRRTPQVTPVPLAPPGKEPLWAQIKAAVDRGGFVLLKGPAGGPQSRLMAEYVTAHGYRLGMLEGKPGDADQPFCTITRLIRRLLEFRPAFLLEPGLRRQLTRLVPELGEPVPPVETEEEREELMSTLTRYLQQMMPPDFAKVADGLHHYDADSLELVLRESALARAAGDRRPHLATFDPEGLSPRNAALLDEHVALGLAAVIPIEQS